MESGQVRIQSINIDGIKSILERRKTDLQKVIDHCHDWGANRSAGRLRVCAGGGRVQYYIRNDAADRNGKYVTKENRYLAANIAQRDYCLDMIRSAEKEINAIERFFSSYPGIQVEEIYGSMHPGRQALIIPAIESAESITAKWKNQQYRRKGFFEKDPVLYTNRGERVRSKSEVIIANTLNEDGYVYLYEKPICLEGVGTVYPDFTILDPRNGQEIILEHLGMLDDPAYLENAVRKVNAYILNGYIPGKSLVLTYETSKQPLDARVIRKLLSEMMD